MRTPTGGGPKEDYHTRYRNHGNDKITDTQAHDERESERGLRSKNEPHGSDERYEEHELHNSLGRTIERRGGLRMYQ